MKRDLLPTTRLGRWSVGLNSFFIVVITTSIVLVTVFGILDFGDHWWDVTVPIMFAVAMIALFTGIRAARKYHERSVSVYLSIALGVCVILFVLLHSLFISD